ncbi:hypothetical protein J2802_001461 [Paraburkholderia caribensis]|nr:hypothetical protein [Paraburkholderia caribensis]
MESIIPDARAALAMAAAGSAHASQPGMMPGSP